MDNETNLYDKLSSKAFDDIRKIWARPELTRNQVAWPAGITLHKKEATNRLVIGFEDSPGQALEWFHPASEETPQQLTFRWDMTVTKDGSVLVVPTGSRFERPTPEQLPLIARLMKMAGIEPMTYQLREPLAPYLPDIAVSDVTLGDLYQTEGNPACSPAWGYISDVRAFRAALMDELKKPL